MTPADDEDIFDSGEEEDDVVEEKWTNLAIDAGRVFTPSAPIDDRALFAGRDEQIRKVTHAVNQKGQHAILYGERGVGKTSLSNILASLFDIPGSAIVAPRINCDITDTFETVWRKGFDDITIPQRRNQAGFDRAPVDVEVPANFLSQQVSPDSVRRGLRLLAERCLPIFIFDEFDRLGPDVRRAMTDTIKTLSDNAVGATVVLVGVAGSVEQLLAEHQSVERALVQIPMPRMLPEEISKIIGTGMKKLDMTIENRAARRITQLSQGLPHYAHLLCLHAAYAAIDSKSKHITIESVETSIEQAIINAQQSIRVTYEQAIRSPRKDSLFADVLLAAAVAEKDELGLFAAQDVRGPLQAITKHEYQIPSFARHLVEFCQIDRGPVLERKGVRYRYRYQFVNPLLQPFVIMKRLHSKRISPQIFD